MMRIMIISHTFREKRFCERWHLLTKLYDDVDVTLIAPKKWKWGTNKNYTFGKPKIQNGIEWEDERFRISLVDMHQNRFLDWYSFGLINEIRKRKPDMIYFIGHHLQTPLVETILGAKFLSKNTKIAAFSMRGLPNQFDIADNILRSIKTKFNKYKWKVVRTHCDALFCHYPHAKKLFRNEGFTKPVYIQTQIGVDSRMYDYSAEGRKRIRDKYNLNACFVFGSATRFSEDKGLFDVLRALPKKGNWKYLLLGSGTKEEEKAIEIEIEKLGLSDKVLRPGFINWQDMPNYWSAMDCVLHVPRTTPNWVETFSLALVQAMSVGVPIIGSDSGSVPYQMSDYGMIIKEGDINSLRNKMIYVMENETKEKHRVRILKDRAIKCFDIIHLTHCFHSVMVDIINNQFDSNKVDMTSFFPESSNQYFKEVKNEPNI